MEIDYKELKKGGFLRQIQNYRFSLRLRVAGGNLDAERLLKVCEIAKRYGKGYVHMTARQSIEIPFIHFNDVEVVKAELAKVGLQPAACGPKVRTVTACQGCRVCPSGLIDTTEIAEEFDKLYYGRELPHKFKLGITGCRNNCLKAEENDLGVKGVMMPKLREKLCTFCGLCEEACRANAISVDKEAQKLHFDQSACVLCGKCVKVCPTSAWNGQRGFFLYFGGTFGNRIAIGEQLLPLIFSKEQLHDVVETTLQFYKDHGRQGERFRTTLDRVGMDSLRKTLEETMRCDR